MSSWINRVRAQSLRWRARTQLRGRHVGQAIELAQRIVTLTPDSAFGWTLLAETQVFAHRYQEAMESADRAIAIEPERAWAWNYRANALMRLGRHDEAVAAFDRVCALDEFARRRVTRLSQTQGLDALLKLRRYEDALAVNDIVIERSPHSSLYWAQRGLIFTEMRRPFEAELAFRNANERAAGRYLQSVALARFYTHWTSDPQRALAICDALVTRYPHSAGAWVERAQALIHFHYYRDAQMAYERAFALGGPSMTLSLSLALLSHNYGIVLSHQGQYARALTEFDQSELDAPGRASVRASRGVIFRRIERYPEALRWFEAAQQAESDNPTMLNLGDVGKGPRGRISTAIRNEIAFTLTCLGRCDEARAILDELLANDPKEGETLICVSFLEGALGHVDNALSAIITALALEPRDALAHATYALALVAQGNPSEALRAVGYSLSIDAFDVRTWRIKAQALRAAGRLEAAAEAERRAAALLAEQTAQVDAYLQARAERGESER